MSEVEEFIMHFIVTYNYQYLFEAAKYVTYIEVYSKSVTVSLEVGGGQHYNVCIRNHEIPYPTIIYLLP